MKIEVKSAPIESILQIAIEHHEAGRLAEAETTYRHVLSREENHPRALHLLGVLASEKGQTDVAINLISRAIAILPSVPSYHSNLGETFRRAGKFTEAIAACRHAIDLNPNYATAHANLGRAYSDQAQRDHDQAQLDCATSAFRDAVRLFPDSPEFHNELGCALKFKLDLDGAIAAFREAVRLRPDFADAYNNLGATLLECGLHDEAITSLRLALQITPGDAGTHSGLIMALGHHPAENSREILAECRRWDLQHAKPHKHKIPNHRNDRSPTRRLRIGYVSPDFHYHVVGSNILPLLLEYDREAFEIFCYSDAPCPDSFRPLANGWRELAEISNEQAAEMIQADGIDILVDLSLHTAKNHLPLFALKPAPIQVSYLGYCGTTGLEAIDYRLSDPHLDPFGDDLSCYSEQTIRLPQSYWCYQPLSLMPLVSPSPCTATGQITFGCLNKFWKVSPACLDLWIDILEAIPSSRFLLYTPADSCRERVVELIAHRGLSPERMEFVGRQPWKQYVQTWQQIDIALDPFPSTGGITSCDALWLGVPVVTLSGRTALGRGGRSILSNIGLPDLIAATPREYMEIARSLAGDVPRLRVLRSSLRDRMEHSPLRDAPARARDIEGVYRKMWHKWCASKISPSE